jgi:integrase
MESTKLVDCAGRWRSPATLPGYHRGRPPRNKGLRYPADPPTVEEIISVMRAAGDSPDGVRLRGVIVVLWRAGLRISEALALNESDLDSERGAVLVRHGKGDKRREVGMDRWAWEQLHPWLELRATLPVGSLFCVLRGATRGRPFGRRDPCPAPQRGSCRRRSPTGCAAPAATCSRRRDVPRGCPVAGHTAPARACRSRDHVGVSARDRQHRNRPRRSRAASADDLGHKRASARSLSRPATEAAPSARPQLPANHQRAPQPRRRSSASR